MKKRRYLYFALFFSVVIALSSCFHDHDMSISVNDDEDVYRFRASFDDNRTMDVQKIINEHLHHSTSFSHGNVRTETRLDDGTSVYIKIRPGRLKIDFDRSENTEESFEKLEQMCDEIKEALTEDHEY